MNIKNLSAISLALPSIILTALMMLFLFPLVLNSAYADATSTTQTALEVAQVLDISAPSSITINCTPGITDASAQLCTTNATVSVNTNNVTGYTLQMNATSGSSTDLTNSAISPSATVSTLSGAYSSSNFPVNSWGYTGGIDKSSETGGYNCASNYCPILAYQSTAPNHTIKITDGPSANSSTTLTFGAKVNTTKPSGTYTTSVTFTAVANEVPAQPIQNGMNMQDIDSATCAATPLYSESSTTYTVVDTRDGGTNYTVARLADGNCWMTQNLELGQTGQSLNLTSDTSNVSSNGYTLTLDTEQSHYKGDSSTKYGNFYTYAQATAGTNPSSGDSQYDICPKNWRLPTYSEHSTLISTYGFSGGDPTEFTNPPISLVFSGVWDSGSLIRQGNFGIWWSSTAEDSSGAHYLRAFDDGFIFTNYDDKSSGLSVRCLTPSV